MATDIELIKTAWKEHAPKELQSFMELYLSSSHNTLTGSEITVALRWALRYLDEDWQWRASELIKKGNFGDGELLTEVEQRKWKNLIRMWPGLSYWRQSQPPDKPTADVQYLEYFMKLTEYFEYSKCPLGSTHAESDPLFMTTRYNGPSNYRHYERDLSCFVLGVPGSGKTAAALWLGYTGLKQDKEKRIFPVYLRFSDIPSLSQILPFWASAVLNYIAIDPASYKERNMAGRAAIAHLLLKYGTSRSGLELALHEGGLARTGLGFEIKDDILRFPHNTPLPELDEHGMLSLIAEFYPSDFKATMIFLDIDLPRRSKDHQKKVKGLIRLMSQLQDLGVFVKVFSKPNLLAGIKSDFPNFDMKWNDEDLREVLRRRLARIVPSELSAWCDPGARMTSPEDRIIRVGTPGGVINNLNQLFKRITLEHQNFSNTDLDQVLGPV